MWVLWSPRVLALMGIVVASGLAHPIGAGAQEVLAVADPDAGALILDISDPTHPTLLGRYDYVLPCNGDPGDPPGCCLSPGSVTKMRLHQESSLAGLKRRQNLPILTIKGRCSGKSTMLRLWT
jgi:hypothetical protein